MKNVLNILMIVSLHLSLAYGADATQSVDTNATLVESVEQNTTVESVEQNTTVESVEQNATIEEKKEMSEFEKLFVNHSAYNYYEKAIESLYKSDYKAAYKNAMSAKEIVDNTDADASQTIALPYMPNYVRESGLTPKRIYYKIVHSKPYELKRVVIKAKLISPPIASVVIKRTSTFMELIVRNYGDLPLDDFEVLLNDESLAKFEKILPNEQKIIRIDKAPTLYEISFKEKYGFAPGSMMLSEDE